MLSFLWLSRRSNQSILKEVSLECSLVGLMLKLKLQYFGHLMWRADSFVKTLMLGKIEGRRRRGRQRMRWLDGITDSMDIRLFHILVLWILPLKTLGDMLSSVAQSCLILCDPMNCSTPGLPVHHQFPESTQTHVHWGGDAIQPSHPLSAPSPPALNLSQHQGLYKWVSSSHQVAKILEFQLQHQSFQWTPRTDLL